MPAVANQYIFPIPSDFYEIEQALIPRLDMGNSPFYKMFPPRNVPFPMVTWEQLDNFYGLMKLRGYNGDPKRVNPVGRSQFSVEPGVYGEFMALDERKMITAREIGTINGVFDIQKNTILLQKMLLLRRLQRIQWITSTLVIQGQFNVTDESGVVVHSDGYQQRTYIAAFPWSNFTQSTPLADLRAMQLYHRGYSVRFDRTCSFVINRTQLNYALNNLNPADLYGRRVEGLQTINSLEMLNKLMSNDDLPMLEVYDDEWYDDSKKLNLWVPTGIGILNGKRESGVPVGGFLYTKSLRNPQGGPYTFVDDRKMAYIPPMCEVHDGFYGGPALEFPSSIVTAFI